MSDTLNWFVDPPENSQELRELAALRKQVVAIKDARETEKLEGKYQSLLADLTEQHRQEEDFFAKPETERNSVADFLEEVEDGEDFFQKSIFPTLSSADLKDLF